MPLQLEALLACDHVIQDAATGKKSLIGIFDRIWTHGFPTQHPQLFLYAKFVGGSPQDKLTAIWRVLGPRGTQQDFPAGEVSISPEGMAELVAQFGGIPFPGPGIYRFVLLLNGHEQGDVRIGVEQIKSESAAVH